MKTSIGSWITLNNLSVAEILSDTGFDWLCIDMEQRYRLRRSTTINSDNTK